MTSGCALIMQLSHLFLIMSESRGKVERLVTRDSHLRGFDNGALWVALGRLIVRRNCLFGLFFAKRGPSFRNMK